VFAYELHEESVADWQAAHLISARQIALADLHWAADVGAGGRITGSVLNRSSHTLVGLEIEIGDSGGSFKGESIHLLFDEVGPGEQQDFTGYTLKGPTCGMSNLPGPPLPKSWNKTFFNGTTPNATKGGSASAPTPTPAEPPLPKGFGETPSGCVYRIISTRGK
jgi:hypothetical protein